MAVTFLSTKLERRSCSPGCPRARARSWRSSIRRQNSLQHWLRERSRACSLSITARFPGGPTRHPQLTASVCSGLANSIPHRTRSRKRSARDTLGTLLSGGISTCTDRAAFCLGLRETTLFRLRAIENQAKWFRRLFSYDDSFLEHAPSCLLDIRDAWAWGHG